MRRQTLLALVAALFPGLVLGQVPVGPEFPVNTHTTGNQLVPRVASDAAGNFVVAWSSYPQDGSLYGAFARRYDTSGAPIDAADLQLNAFTSGTQAWPAVAAAPDGRLAFAWHTDGQDGDGLGIYSRLFDAAGAPAGGEFLVNSYATGQQMLPSIAADANGNFVVVWTDHAQQDGSGRGIFGQRFDSAGGALGGEFPVNTFTAGHQFNHTVAASANGRFVVVWESYDQDGSERGVFAQRYDTTGAPDGPEFRVNEYTTGAQVNASVAADAAGNFVVVWSTILGIGGWDVVARRYDATGAALGSEFIVNDQTAGTQDQAKVAFDRGRFVVVWHGIVGATTYGVFGRAFKGATPVTDDFPVDTLGTGAQLFPSIAANAAGDFVVAWTNYAPGVSDILARRFVSDLIFEDNFESGDLSAWDTSATDGGDLSVQPAAALNATTAGLQGFADDTAGLYVQDDSPRDEPRYRARFWIDPNGFDPGEAQQHLRTRVFIAFTEAPTRRVAALVLRLQSGVYSLRGRARLDDNVQADTPFFDISDGPHAVEIDLRPATGPEALDGSFELFIDGASMVQMVGLDNSLSAVDFVRMGALSVKTGATGTLYWDEFESRRQTYIGP